MQRTVSLVLKKKSALCKTIFLYNQIVNEHVQYSLAHKTLSKNHLHHSLYKELRRKYPQFPSALIQCARDQAVEMLKGNKRNTCTKKRLDSSIRFDQRTMKVLLESGELQLSTVKGRKKYKIKVPENFKKYFLWKVKSLNLGTAKKHMIVKIIVDGKVPEQSGFSEVLGIDLGLRNFAALSNGQLISSKEINRVKRIYAHVRKVLQSKGTRSAKRKLQSLTGRERRFMMGWNHRLTKDVASLPYGAFALEDLRGIRNGRKGKVFNRKRSNWAYAQFRNFLQYKAEEQGKFVILVDPRYTSQQCKNCLYIDKNNRKGKNFHCIQCNFQSDADIN
ncbi:IS200/IS605 family element transposase accessory protein TnpB, partial [Candidatus Woesearchaeota archaeon]|nr:IS200/IS605 family element transposase accessory protein TnpB [Candidatus Woesearchaeota archaeon]